MYYLDASVLVAVLNPEALQVRAQAWLAENSDSELFISRWVETEVASALSIKQRQGDLSDSHRLDVERVFDGIMKESLEVLSVVDGHFIQASRYAAQPKTGLRAGDSLHLAIANAYGLTVATLDKRMASGGKAVGVSTLLV